MSTDDTGDDTTMADYILACGSVVSLPVTSDMLQVDRRQVSGVVMCGRCQTECQVIERLDSDDLHLDVVEVSS